MTIPAGTTSATITVPVIKQSVPVTLPKASWNICVNVILPGSIETNIQERTYSRNLDRIRYDITMPRHFPPLHGRRGDPEEVAQLALFLASDASRYITGAVIPADAAFSLAR